MTDKIEHLMPEQFRRIRDDIATLQASMDGSWQETVAAYHDTQGLELVTDVHSNGLEDLRKRVDRIERRLDLTDPVFRDRLRLTNRTPRSAADNNNRPATGGRRKVCEEERICVMRQM